MMSTPLRSDIFTDSPERGMGADSQTPTVRFGGGREGFLVGEIVVLGVLVAGDLFTGHAQLDQVCTHFDVAAHLFTHLFGAVSEGGRLG